MSKLFLVVLLVLFTNVTQGQDIKVTVKKNGKPVKGKIVSTIFYNYHKSRYENIESKKTDENGKATLKFSYAEKVFISISGKKYFEECKRNLDQDLLVDADLRSTVLSLLASKPDVKYRFRYEDGEFSGQQEANAKKAKEEYLKTYLSNNVREFPDGVYVGDFIIQKDNKIPNGKGKITYNSKISDKAEFFKTISYEGEWSNGLANGQGTLIYADGIKFVGNFVNGGIGHGTMHLRDGVQLEGDWIHNRDKCIYISLYQKSYAITGFAGNYCPVRWLKNANAKMIYKDGTVKEGYWQPTTNGYDITQSDQVSFIASDIDTYTNIMALRQQERNESKNAQYQKRQEELSSYEATTVPSIKSQNCSESSSLYDGKYTECKITYSDGVEGRYFIGKDSGKYFLAELLTNHYYKSYDAVIRALYIYKKHSYITNAGKD